MFALNQAPTLDEPWLQFKNLQVRQLAFCLSSPNILQSIPSELRFKQHTFQLHSQHTWAIHFKNYHARLLYLDRHPQELELFLQRLKSTRLGLRFEMFIWFWLLDQAYHPYQVLGHSIQKIVARQTIGELDFLLLNHENNQVEHWEVALKYYLAETDYTLPCWYGLNRSDQLIRKLNHFSQQQFQFDEALEQTIEQRFVVLKGQLYLPLQHRLLPLPDWVNQERRLGYWGSTIPANHAQFYRLHRQEWICPAYTPTSQPAHWWINGLYRQYDQPNYYMFRNSALLLQDFKSQIDQKSLSL